MSARTAASSGESESMAEPWDIKPASSVLLWSVAVLPVGCCWSDVSAAAESDTKPKAKKPAEIIRISRRTWPPSQSSYLRRRYCNRAVHEKHPFGKEFFKIFAKMLRTGNYAESPGRKNGLPRGAPRWLAGALREAPLQVVGGSNPLQPTSGA